MSNGVNLEGFYVHSGSYTFISFYRLKIQVLSEILMETEPVTSRHMGRLVLPQTLTFTHTYQRILKPKENV
jgi:hypothetical protein